METHFSEAEKLYTDFVTSGCDRTVLERADKNLLLLLSAKLQDSGLWDLMHIDAPNESSEKADIVESLYNITVLALNGDRFFTSEVAEVKRTKVIHNRFRLREAELENWDDEQGDKQSYETSPKKFDMRMTAGRRLPAPRISEEQLKVGWLPVQDYLQQHIRRKATPKEIRALSLLLRTFFGDPDSVFTIDGKEYAPKDLFGYFYSGSRSSYFINPIAAPLLTEAMDLAPMLPEDRQHWLSTTLMATNIYDKYTAHRGLLVNKLAAQLLRDPLKEVNIGTAEEPQLCKVNEIVGKYRKPGVTEIYFFDPRAQAYLERRLGVCTSLPENKRHYLDEKVVAEKADMSVSQARKCIREITLNLRNRERIEYYDNAFGAVVEADPGDVILHVKGNANYKNYIHPDVADQYFDAQKIRACVSYVPEQTKTLDEIAELKAKGWLTLNEMATICFGQSSQENNQSLQSLMGTMTKDPQMKIEVHGSEDPHTLADVTRTYQSVHGAAYLFDPRIERALQKRLGIPQTIDDEHKDWPKETEFYGTSIADRRTVQDLISGLQHDKTVAVYEPELNMTIVYPVEEAIKKFRGEQVHRLMPRLAEQYFSDPIIHAHGLKLRNIELAQQEGAPQILPKDGVERRPASEAFRGLRLPKPYYDRRDAVCKLMQERGVKGVGLYQQEHGGSPVYWVDMSLTKDGTLTRDSVTQMIEEMDSGKDSHIPMLPPEKKHWKTINMSLRRLSMPEDYREQLEPLVKHLHEQGTPDIGLYRVSRGTAMYHIDPEIMGVGKFFTGQSVQAMIRDLRAQGILPTPPDVGMGSPS